MKTLITRESAKVNEIFCQKNIKDVIYRLK